MGQEFKPSCVLRLAQDYGRAKPKLRERPPEILSRVFIFYDKFISLTFIVISVIIFIRKEVANATSIHDCCT